MLLLMSQTKEKRVTHLAEDNVVNSKNCIAAFSGAIIVPCDRWVSRLINLFQRSGNRLPAYKHYATLWYFIHVQRYKSRNSKKKRKRGKMQCKPTHAIRILKASVEDKTKAPLKRLLVGAPACFIPERHVFPKRVFQKRCFEVFSASPRWWRWHRSAHRGVLLGASWFFCLGVAVKSLTQTHGKRCHRPWSIQRSRLKWKLFIIWNTNSIWRDINLVL